MPSPREQFEKDYEEYSDAIFRYLYYRIQDRERALELTQEVFTKFWQYLSQDKTVENSRAFLYRSAANIFINEIRTDKRTVSLDTLMEDGFEITYEGEDAESIASQKEIVDQLKDVDEQYRDVLVMRFVEDMAVKEIAKTLGEKENTISVRIKRGLEKFRQKYERFTQ